MALREENMKLAAVSALVGVVTACAGSWLQVTPRPLSTVADSAEYAGFAGKGTLELDGQAFLTTRDGSVMAAAGRLVTLDPTTTYAREWFRRFGADFERFEDPAPDPRFVAARRTTVTDGEGRFRFARLLPGIYMVRSTVMWESEDWEVHGGVVAAQVRVEEDEPNEVAVHRLYTPDQAAALGVEIVTDDELAERRYKVLGRVSGTACDTYSEEPARWDLTLQAGRKGANAVAGVVCRKRGISLAKNCISRIVCEGDAVGWM
jgi:uncharacterized protein YbjQ (UPF0145 family)